jgi:CspA family cold shock protein
MAMGKVRWFNPTKATASLCPMWRQDVFVHISAAGYAGLVEGARVSYELRPVQDGKPTAENLRFG